MNLPEKAHDTCVAQIAEALFGQPGMSLMEMANRRAEIEALVKDAGRWRYARKLLAVDDISERQRELDAWKNLVSEEECKRADKAIDAAMKEQAE